MAGETKIPKPKTPAMPRTPGKGAGKPPGPSPEADAEMEALGGGSGLAEAATRRRAAEEGPPAWLTKAQEDDEDLARGVSAFGARLRALPGQVQDAADRMQQREANRNMREAFGITGLYKEKLQKPPKWLDRFDAKGHAEAPSGYVGERSMFGAPKGYAASRAGQFGSMFSDAPTVSYADHEAGIFEKAAPTRLDNPAISPEDMVDAIGPGGTPIRVAKVRQVEAGPYQASGLAPGSEDDLATRPKAPKAEPGREGSPFKQYDDALAQDSLARVASEKARRERQGW